MSSLPTLELDNECQTRVVTVVVDGSIPGVRFDGIGVVNGGGATSVLLKDYPEPQRSQILDLVFKPKFGASVSALFVEIPGDGNATQGSMPSHMHIRDDLNYARGYTWWVLREAAKRNPQITLDGTAWSAPGWVGQGESWAEGEFWSQDAADYYVKWLEGLRSEYGLEFTAIGCRNEKGSSFEFAKRLRSTLDENGFANVKIHAFDHWPDSKFDWVTELRHDAELRAAVDIIGAHVMERSPASAEVQALAAELKKPIWNTEEHVYKKGFDCLISIVRAFNLNFIRSGATKIVNWYDIAAIYPVQPYAVDPAMMLAHWPWCGHYEVREALWGYAHYGQFTEIGWEYLRGGCGELPEGGSYVTLRSPGSDYSIIIETRDATAPQELEFQVLGDSVQSELCLWTSNAKEQFQRQADVSVIDGRFRVTVHPGEVYSLSTTRGQQKGEFNSVPEAEPFPFPYLETFEDYSSPAEHGYLPRYTADIAGAFELVEKPDAAGQCLRQVVPIPTISWAPDWKPYTIVGDENWTDYEVSADVWLNPGDSAGVMGRINHVGTGYGFVPKGYLLRLASDGQLQLAVIRGKVAKQELVGDAEQQAIIRAANEENAGGEKLLASGFVPSVKPNGWHNLKLQFQGDWVKGFVDNEFVLEVRDATYPNGMAGLLAEQESDRMSTPYFDRIMVKAVGADAPEALLAKPGQRPIYMEETL